MIIKEAIGHGSTVEQAREDAIAKLNADLEENIRFETVAVAKKKILGIFGGSDAQVRAYVEGPDSFVTSDRKSAPKKEKAEKTLNNKKKSEIKAEKVNKLASVEIREEKKTEAEAKGVSADKLNKDSQIGRAYTYLQSVLKQLGCDGIDAMVYDVEGGSKIVLSGSDKLGVIIGRRGETLDALQYLTSLIANENSNGYYRIVIDIGNYREKRENTLESLAKRTASQVLRTGRSRSLEPMNPYERRIIHTAVQNIDGVYSSSVGDGSNRRVVIVPEGKSVHNYNRSANKGSRQNRSNDHAVKVDSSKSEAVQKPKETDGMKLYGKLK